MAQAPDEPDWSIWSKADAVELQDAVALSIDIGPGGQRHQYAKRGEKLYRPAEPDRDNYHERISLSLSHLGRDLPLAEPRLPPGMPPETNKVRLVDFAAFALRMGWKLADNFPWKEMTYVDDKGNKTTLVNVDGKQMVRTPAGGYISQEQWHAMTHPPREPAPPIPPWLDPSPDVDWELWRHKESAELWEVVAVSLGRNPDFIKLLRPTTPENARIFQRRLEQAKSALGLGLRAVKIDEDNPQLSRIRLRDFASWFFAMKPPLSPPLPDDFPGAKHEIPATAEPAVANGRSSTPSNAPGITTRLPHTTTALEAIFKVMREHWTSYDPKNPPKQTVIASDLDRALGWKSAKDGSPSRNAQNVAALMRPDALSESDNRGKKRGSDGSS